MSQPENMPQPEKTPYELIPSTSQCSTCFLCNKDFRLLKSQKIGDTVICPNCKCRLVILEDMLYNLPDAISVSHDRPVITAEMAKNMPCPFPPWKEDNEEKEEIVKSPLARKGKKLDELIETIRRA